MVRRPIVSTAGTASDFWDSASASSACSAGDRPRAWALFLFSSQWNQSLHVCMSIFNLFNLRGGKSSTMWVLAFFRFWPPLTEQPQKLQSVVFRRFDQAAGFPLAERIFALFYVANPNGIQSRRPTIKLLGSTTPLDFANLMTSKLQFLSLCGVPPQQLVQVMQIGHTAVVGLSFSSVVPHCCKFLN